jgi:hypothetical protein
LAEEEANLAKDRNALRRYGVSTDENGLITNYDEVIAAQVAQYNKNPEKYQEAYDEFMKRLEQYEETLETVKNTKEQLDDTFYHDLELKLENIDYSIELEVRLSDLD